MASSFSTAVLRRHRPRHVAVLVICLALAMVVSGVGAALAAPQGPASTVDFHILTDGNYRSLRLKTISAVEGAILCPYVDAVGVPTIGIGFNLQVKENRDAVLDTLAPNLTGSQRNALGRILTETYDP